MSLRTVSLPLAVLVSLLCASVADAEPCAAAPPARSYFPPAPQPAAPRYYSPGVQRMPTVSPPSYWSTYPRNYSWNYAPAYNWSWNYAVPVAPNLYYSYPTYSYYSGYYTYPVGPYFWYRIR